MTSSHNMTATNGNNHVSAFNRIESFNVSFDYKGCDISLTTISNPPELIVFKHKSGSEVIFGPVSPCAEGIKEAMAHIDSIKGDV